MLHDGWVGVGCGGWVGCGVRVGAWVAIGVGVLVGSWVGVDVGKIVGATVGVAMIAACWFAGVGVGAMVLLVVPIAVPIMEKKTRSAIIAPHPIPIFAFWLLVWYHLHSPARFLPDGTLGVGAGWNCPGW